MLKTAQKRRTLDGFNQIPLEVPNMTRAANLIKLNENCQSHSSVRYHKLRENPWLLIETPAYGQKKICLVAWPLQSARVQTAQDSNLETEPASSGVEVAQNCQRISPSRGNTALQSATQELTLMPRTPGYPWRLTRRRPKHIFSTTPP